MLHLWSAAGWRGALPDPEAHAQSRILEKREANPLFAGAYRTDWPRDEEGYALIRFSDPHTRQEVTLPCFAPWHDPVTGQTFPFKPRETKLPGWVLRIVSQQSPNQWKERAAHIGGRDTSQHGRWYFTDAFFRDFYFVALHSAKARQTRSDRRWKIRRAHREAHCTDPCCRKRHR